jgi:hypothetical protein
VIIGQSASVDTRNGLISGHVIRIDPSVQNGTRTVDVSLEGDLPKGAVPDLSVDGTIELERLNDVLYMGRPAFGQSRRPSASSRSIPTASKRSAFRCSSGAARSTRWKWCRACRPATR